ncbi:hypothetical protein BDV25DRAFT_138033 [Aspergillus avenaceus]|uniref:P-loop containing nucleoside triphosphate hydrolase protein n=1 Tax=Aspergillus avenaceus TaxID=36643 RepID=A0A5N6U0Y5_ASPAV|nr:hypothetical protein BDV25DRAFT_138033 [Aspergillus avenaceus]
MNPNNTSPAKNLLCQSKFHSIFDEKTVRYQLRLIESAVSENVDDESAYAPIISSNVLARQSGSENEQNQITQYGLLAGSTSIRDSTESEDDSPLTRLNRDPRLLYNVSHPSSIFICGSQGSGKSHTLSCILENCLIPSNAGGLPNPLTSIIFHYDTFISDTSGSPCEAAFLSSDPGVQVRVLCSPTNTHSIRGTYSRFNIPVDPLELDESHLNTKRMMDLMAVGQDDGSIPLYTHTIKRILREMRIEQQRKKGSGIFSYQDFKGRLMSSSLTTAQLAPLKQRLDTLESFMPQEQVSPWKRRARPSLSNWESWEPVPGRLTIVDLSCPCIAPETACSLFNICLGIFLEQDPSIGRVVALDEAHKYMDASTESRAFTDTLLATVRLQRHLGTRVIISTQEPTVSTNLLSLCNVTIVHRFTSPAWLQILQKHIAAAAKHPFTSNAIHEGGSEASDSGDNRSLFDRIVQLRVGEALLFAPSAVVKASLREDGQVQFHQLGSDYLTVKVRQRLTTDGGKSVCSS